MQKPDEILSGLFSFHIKAHNNPHDTSTPPKGFKERGRNVQIIWLSVARTSSSKSAPIQSIDLF